MQFRVQPVRIQTTISNVSGAQMRTGARRAPASLALLGAALVLALMPLRAFAQSTHIYMYDAQGAPVEVTQSYLYQEHYVYDLAGNPVGSVDSQNVIYNASSQQIGYVTVVPDP